MKIEQVYHPFQLWEDHQHGFYNNVSGNQKKQMLIDVVEFFCDPVTTKKYMDLVVRKWRYSCEHNLTNPSMNKIAYIGQAACALFKGIPSTITMEAWSNIDDNYKDIANKISQECLDLWEVSYSKDLLMKSSDNKC